MAEHALMCPFLDPDPGYANGVEFGMLWARLRDESVDVIEDFVTTANQEQVTLAANRLGWRVAEMEPWEGAPGDWTWFRLERL